MATTADIGVLTEQEPSGPPAAPPTRRQAAGLLARAFRDEPNFVDLFPDPATRRRALPHVFGSLLRDAGAAGRVHTATRASDLVGVAVWLPPGGFPLTAGRVLRTLPDGLRMAAAAPRSLARVLRFTAGAAALHPDEPHWYLAAVGVDPEAQGHGIGTRLLRPVLGEADATGRPCYLETHRRRNVAWYQTLGFEVRAETSLTRGGPRTWTMLRPGSRS